MDHQIKEFAVVRIGGWQSGVKKLRVYRAHSEDG